MIESLFVVVGQVLTLFLLMAVGFGLVKYKKLSNQGISDMSFLLLYIVNPCLMVSSFQLERSDELIHSLLITGLVMVLYYLFHVAVSLCCYKKQPAQRRGVLRFGMVYPNGGYMGIPLLTAILGDDSLIFAVVGMVVFNVFQWTHGVFTMGGKVSLRKAFLNPGVIGFSLGLVVFLTGWWQQGTGGFAIPSFVLETAGYLGKLNTPVAMMIVGAQLANSDFKGVFRQPVLYGCTAYTLVIAPLVVMLAFLPLQLSPIIFCSCIILNATPAAGATSILAQRFGGDTTLAAQLITLSTLLSIFTLPVIATLAQGVAGLI